MFVGFDSLSGAHYHTGTQALFAGVAGEKTVVFYPPKDSPYLYPHKWYLESYHYSRVNFDQDLSQYPKLKKTHPVECTLRPGELLFIPIHWWHLVRGHGFTVNLTLFWRAERRHHHYPTPGLRTDFCRVAKQFFGRFNPQLPIAKTGKEA
jgi:hypothetical protein